jgi:hypothetical protein
MLKQEMWAQIFAKQLSASQISFIWEEYYFLGRGLMLWGGNAGCQHKVTEASTGGGSEVISFLQEPNLLTAS